MMGKHGTHLCENRDAVKVLVLVFYIKRTISNKHATGSVFTEAERERLHSTLKRFCENSTKPLIKLGNCF